MSGIYTIVHVASGRRYIGSSHDVALRWRQHRNRLAAGRHHNRRLQSTWNKCGPAAFAFEFVEEVPVADLAVAEQRHIDGVNGPVFNVGKYVENPNRGLSLSETYRRNIATALRTEDVRRRISDGVKRSYTRGDRKPATRPPHSLETRQKMSAAQRAVGHRNRSPHTAIAKANIRAALNRPEVRERIRAKSYEAMSRPGAREHHAAAVQAWWDKRRVAAGGE